MAVPPDLLRAAVELYVDLHLHPELSGAERRTAGRLASWLAADGYEVTRDVGGHGVLGALRRGPGPVVLLRAELDALPVTEATGLPYASSTPGAMHACGHDLHLAALAGAARLLARDATWRGTLLVVGQPAEETLDGARAMLADGLYELTGLPDTVLAQHAAPLPAGTVAHGRGGPVMAGSVALDAVLHGAGGHAGAPHLTVDPVVAAAAAVLRLQTVVSRETAPAEQAVVTVSRLAAGAGDNVVPDRAELGISLRAFGEPALERLLAAVRRVLAAEADASGCPRPPDVTVRARSRALVPDGELGEALRAAHAGAFGAGRVLPWPPATATEDFGWFGAGGAELHGGAAIRTGYWMLGTVAPADWRATTTGAGGDGSGNEDGDGDGDGPAALPANHSPAFAPHVRTALPTGVEALVTAARLALRAAAPMATVTAAEAEAVR